MRILQGLGKLAARLARRFPAQTVAATLVAPWMLFSFGDTLGSPLFSVLDLLFIASAGAGLVVGVVQLGVRANKWPAVVAMYAALVNLGVAEFAYLYWSVSQQESSSFSVALTKLDSAYFSWTTFTTTGFGDIAPLSQLARMSVTAEMMLTFAAVAGGLAVVVGSRRAADGDAR